MFVDVIMAKLCGWRSSARSSGNVLDCAHICRSGPPGGWHQGLKDGGRLRSAAGAAGILGGTGRLPVNVEGASTSRMELMARWWHLPAL